MDFVFKLPFVECLISIKHHVGFFMVTTDDYNSHVN